MLLYLVALEIVRSLC